MRTWTIYLACSEAEKVWNPYRNENFDTYPAKRVARAERQTLKFSAELERRMNERDALVASRNMNKTRTFTDEGGRFMTITGKWGI